MSFFAIPVASSPTRTKHISPLGIGTAAILAGMLVAQLFTFEDLPQAIADAGFLNEAWGRLAAGIIVFFELLALPFLLRMYLSPAMRVGSMIAGWFVVSVWLVVSLWKNIVGETSPSLLLGATVALPEGWWSVLFCLALAVLVGWVSWGMGPFKAKSVK